MVVVSVGVVVTDVVDVFSPKTLWPTLAAKNKPVRVIYAVGMSGNFASFVFIVVNIMTKSKPTQRVNVHIQFNNLVVEAPDSSLKNDLNQPQKSLNQLLLFISININAKNKP